MKARIRGVQVHMQQFEFFFGLALGRNLQSLFAAEGQREADLPFLKRLFYQTASAGVTIKQMSTHQIHYWPT